MRYKNKKTGKYVKTAKETLSWQGQNEKQLQQEAESEKKPVAEVELEADQDQEESIKQQAQKNLQIPEVRDGVPVAEKSEKAIPAAKKKAATKSTSTRSSAKK